MGFESSSLFPFLLFFLAASILLCARHAESAPANSEVKRFPGFDGDLPSKHYAGYITVGNDVFKRHLYYYFATSEHDPSKDPLLLFTNGGPGCAALHALLSQAGPFKFKEDKDYPINEPKVELNTYSWTKVSSIIYVDSPAGTGFSYADDHDYTTDDTKTVIDLYEFTVKWFLEFPEFLRNPFYVAGSSYGGFYTPALSLEIADGIEAGMKPVINFKGYIVGNGVTDLMYDLDSRVSFAHRMGLISDELYEDLRDSCLGSYWNASNFDCLRNLDTYGKMIDGINYYHVLFPPCQFGMAFSHSDSFISEDWLLRDPVPDTMSGHIHCDETIIVGSNPITAEMSALQAQESTYCSDYANRPARLFNPQTSRRDVLAVEEDVSGEWKRCTDRLVYQRTLTSLIQHHLNLTMKGYRAFIYNGDHDMAIPYIGTLSWIKSLNYAVIEKWRPWFVGDQIAGYTVRFDHNLTFSTVKGAGHTASEWMPREMLAAFARWVNGRPL